ncbi:MAG: hypothetical protein QHJ73_01810, partial [Armatimonadota bacterium]|nr:hypothetical protein [Armatimonadota bacterium]
WSTAQDIQYRITRGVRAILRYPGIGALKAMVTARGIPMGEPRRPLAPVSLSAGHQLNEEIRALFQ